MVSSRIGNRLLAALCIASLLLCGCKPRTVYPDVVLPEAVRAVMYDTASVNFVNFSEYGELRHLPIGIFDADSTSMTLLETARNMDCFDNVTGARGSDGILDFAGEYFQYYTAGSDEDCFGSALFLMKDRYWDSFEKERSKIVVAGGYLTSSGGLDEMAALSDNNGAGVKIISEIEAGVRAMFDSLANDNISSFTIAALSDSSRDAVRANSEAVRRVAANNGNTRSISIIGGDDSLEGLSQIVDNLRSDNSKSPLKVIMVEGADEGFLAGCEALLERYRSMFVNGTYPYRSILADKIIFIDPSLSASVECYETLRHDGNLALRAEKQKVSYFYGF